MTSKRVHLPAQLAAEVMFASDRTCCVCRREKNKTQIHHIDGDPSNNDVDNLAVICLHCHSDAHTDGAFVRNLIPELLSLYNRNWRALVAKRLHSDSDPTGQSEFTSEAFLQASLDCHSWKVSYMAVYGPEHPQSEPGQFIDVWDAMIELWTPEYTPQQYERFKALFDSGIRDVQRRLDRLIQLFPDVLPYEFRTTLVRAHRQLETERVAYLSLPRLLQLPDVVGKETLFFRMRFTEVLGVLRDVARDADRRREAVDGTTEAV